MNWFYIELAGEGYAVLAESQTYAGLIVEAYRPDKKVQRIGVRKGSPTTGDAVLKQVAHVKGSEDRIVNFVCEGA